MSAPPSNRLLESLFYSLEMREIFSDHRRLQGMLDFEAALARSLVRAGLAPSEVLPPIESHCRASLFDFDAIAQEAALAGNLAIPMLRQLTALVARADPKAAGFIHLGATSQDAIDTGMILQLRDALERFDANLGTLSAGLARLAEKHISTPLAGRTWLQQASPVTLGLKAAGWLGAMDRHHARLRQARKQVMVLQFGGAVGTLASLGDKAHAVASALAEELKLDLPALPWHSHRDRFGEVATSLGLLVASLGKIARDISLMAQTEVDELSEPDSAGRGGSSTMPHKRNPVGSAVVLAAAIRVPPLVSTMLASMVQEHERGLGGWQAEWETLPEICLLASGALSHLTNVVNGLDVHESKMAENLDATHGLILAEAVSTALAVHMGRASAHELVEQACRRALKDGKSLRESLLADQTVRTHLSEKDVDRLLDPKNYTGSAGPLVKSALSKRDHER